MYNHRANKAKRGFMVFGLLLLVLGTLSGIAIAQTPVASILAAAKAAVQKYPHANAVYLQNDTRLRLNADGTFTEVAHRRILLLTRAGVKAYGAAIAEYYQGIQTASVDYVRVIYPNGKVVTAPPQDIHRSPVYKLWYQAGLNATSSTLSPANAHPYMFLYVAPAIEQLGAVIDWQITTTGTSLWPGLAHEISGIQLLAAGVPSLEWRFDASVPIGTMLNWRVVGSNMTPSVSFADGTVHYTFSATDIPAIDTTAPHMPSIYALSPWVIISTLTNWDEISRAYGKAFFASAVPTAAIREKAEELTSGCTTQQDKVNAIYKFVMQKISYFMTGYLFPFPAVVTFAQGKGDCQDQAALLVAMLKAVGVDAYPVLLNAEPGMDVDFSFPPTFSVFDHVIVAVPEGAEWRFLDPSAGSLWTLDILPSRDRDRHGLLILGEKYTPGIVVQTNTSTSADSTSSTVAQFTLSPDGMLTGQAITTLVGDIAPAWRAQAFESKIYEAYSESLDTQLSVIQTGSITPQAEMLSVSTSDPFSAHDPFTITAKFQIPWMTYLSSSQRWKIITLLRLLPFVTASDYNPQLASGSRKYPYLMTPQRIDTRIYVTIPAGVRPDLPKDIDVTTSVGSFAARYYYLPGTKQRTVVVERHLEFDVTKIPVSNMGALQAIVTQLRSCALRSGQ